MIGGSFQRARRNLCMIAQDDDVRSEGFVALAWLLEDITRRVPEVLGPGPLCTTTSDGAVALELHQNGSVVVAVFSEPEKLWKVWLARGTRGNNGWRETAHLTVGDRNHAADVFVSEMTMSWGRAAR